VRTGLIIAALLASACSHATKPAPKPDQIGWRPVGTWSGHGDEQTDSFEIESGQFRIKWVASNENPAGAGTLKLIAHSAVSGRPLVVALEEHRGNGHGTALVSDEPRPYYIVIESKNLDWTISIEEAVVGQPAGS
jgi:hypothetical protein